MTPEDRFYEAANACCEKGHGNRYTGGKPRRVICNDCASEAIRAAQVEAIERCATVAEQYGEDDFGDEKVPPGERIAIVIRALKEEG